MHNTHITPQKTNQLTKLHKLGHITGNEYSEEKEKEIKRSLIQALESY
jgi:hypothetical protein